MKKLFAVLALAGVLVSCDNKKKDEKKETTSDTTTTTNTTTPTDNTTTTTPTDNTTTASGDVPTFSDPEVQKFVNDYNAFIVEYKAGMKDPAKLADLSKKMQDWSTRSMTIGTKLANNPADLQKWNDWWTAKSKELMPQQ